MCLMFCSELQLENDRKEYAFHVCSMIVFRNNRKEYDSLAFYDLHWLMSEKVTLLYFYMMLIKQMHKRECVLSYYSVICMNMNKYTFVICVVKQCQKSVCSFLLVIRCSFRNLGKEYGFHVCLWLPLKNNRQEYFVALYVFWILWGGEGSWFPKHIKKQHKHTLFRQASMKS